MISILAFIVGVAVGAFSHKYLAAEAKKVTGVDPAAAADAVKKVL